MLRIELDQHALAAIRFAISPLHTTEGVLRSVARHPANRQWAHPARAALRAQQLSLLAGLFGGAAGYVPDFLVPGPAGFSGDVQQELHQVATTPARRVRDELQLTVRGLDGSHPDSARVRRTLLAALDGGEAALASRVAAELERFWTVAVFRRWPGLRDRMDADIVRRSHVTARYGLSSMLAGLGSGIVWKDGELRASGRVSAHVTGVRQLVLIPAVISGRAGSLIDQSDRTDPANRRHPIVYYPPFAHAEGRSQRGDPAADLLGATRAALLADLPASRSTTELAHRHGLSPATVSHHLGVLLRAQLVTRSRDGRRVLYRQVTRGRELLDGGPGPD
ncbi:MAG TPA: helix-turn-helix domain-containing protein [Pseudonocardia sp.]